MKNKETAHELKALCRAIINKDISRPLLTAYAHSYLAISEQDYEIWRIGLGTIRKNNLYKQQQL
jgi:hypothetical protein